MKLVDTIVQIMRLNKDQRYRPPWDLLQRNPSVYAYLRYYALAVGLVGFLSLLYARYYHCCFRAKSRLIAEEAEENLILNGMSTVTDGGGCGVDNGYSMWGCYLRARRATGKEHENNVVELARTVKGYRGVAAWSPSKLELGMVRENEAFLE